MLIVPYKMLSRDIIWTAILFRRPSWESLKCNQEHPRTPETTAMRSPKLTLVYRCESSAENLMIISIWSYWAIFCMNNAEGDDAGPGTSLIKHLGHLAPVGFPHMRLATTLGRRECAHKRVQSRHGWAHKPLSLGLHIGHQVEAWAQFKGRTCTQGFSCTFRGVNCSSLSQDSTRRKHLIKTKTQK